MKKKLNIRQRKNLASPAKRGRVYKVQDQGAKAVFEPPQRAA